MYNKCTVPLYITMCLTSIYRYTSPLYVTHVTFAVAQHVTVALFVVIWSSMLYAVISFVVHSRMHFWHTSYNCCGFLRQHTITSVHWDPTGQILATTAAEPVVHVWYPGDGQWECLYGLKHCQPVNITAWCTMTGKGEAPQLMLARSVDTIVDKCYMNQ